MRTEGPFPLRCTQGSGPNTTVAPVDQIPVRDYLYKTVEVTGLVAGTLLIKVQAGSAFFTVASITANGIYLIQETGFFMLADATAVTGSASLAVVLTVMNARAD